MSEVARPNSVTNKNIILDGLNLKPKINKYLKKDVDLRHNCLYTLYHK